MTKQLSCVCLVIALIGPAVFGVPAVGAQSNRPLAALRIVVVEGEDAVNIVQQKTAIAPLVEVRDRNDQPVAGVVVRFAIRNGRATFDGARNLTVMTNAAGRAAASGLVPTGNGALQISATAAFQGQTAAVTIAQTNVMTMAEAATVSGAGASSGGAGASTGAGGAAGGTGGGLSATTIGIVGGAVAGGVLATTQALSKGVPYSGTYSGSIVPSSLTPNSGCVWTEEHAGTIDMELEIADDGAVHGHGSTEGTVNIVQVTPPGCQSFASPDDGKHGSYGEVVGTKNGLTYNSNHPGLAGTTWFYEIVAAFSGEEIVGTFTLRVTFPNGQPKTIVFPITLRKQ